MDTLRVISLFINLVWGFSLIWIVVGTLIGLLLLIFYFLTESRKRRSILKKFITLSFTGWIVFIITFIVIFLLRIFEETTGTDLRYFPADL